MVNILIVDDEVDIVTLFGEMLRREGHEVRGCYNGKEALEEIEKEKPDLLILDVMMPIMDGWEVCHKIKTDEKTKDIKVEMLTVRRSYQDKIKSFNESLADWHIAKPIDKDRFLEEIRNILRE
ncbi:MAG: response regulator [Candidatus Hydrothermarchaeales archaeon]